MALVKTGHICHLSCSHLYKYSAHMSRAECQENFSFHAVSGHWARMGAWWHKNVIFNCHK